MSQASPELHLTDVPAGTRVAVVTAQWNGHITSRLEASARTVLDGTAGVTGAYFHVPGCIELTYAAARLVASSLYDAVVVLGCVLRGDTPHFDYVCQSVTQGVTALNAQGRFPVIFGILTVDNEQQALDRTGGTAGDKGAEAALTALQMAAFTAHIA